MENIEIQDLSKEEASLVNGGIIGALALYFAVCVLL